MEKEMKKLITAALLTLLIPATSFAARSFVDGNQLLNGCTNIGDFMNKSNCTEFINMENIPASRIKTAQIQSAKFGITFRENKSSDSCSCSGARIP
jgi:hypothetical protein